MRAGVHFANSQSDAPPLPPVAVAALSDGLLAEDDARRVACLLTAIECDAVLRDWAIRAHGVDAPNEQLAEHLAGRLPRLVVAYLANLDESGAPTEDVRRLGELAALRRRVDELERRFEQSLDDAKLTALAEFAAGAGHEMNNPLAVISGRAQLLLRGETVDARRADLALIKAQATRVHEMIADLMLFARPPSPLFRRRDVRSILERTLEILRTAADAKGIRLRCETETACCEADVDEAQLAVVIRTLIENAIQAATEQGIVVVAAARVESECGDSLLRISVGDNGPGVPADQRERIFDPYYSGRQAGRGLGMGLPKCWRIVQLHRGVLAVAASALGGAEFTMTLPVAQGDDPRRGTTL